MAKTKKCKNCPEVFEIKRNWQEFCSAKCRREYWDKYNPRIPLNTLSKRVDSHDKDISEIKTRLKKLEGEQWMNVE